MNKSILSFIIVFFLMVGLVSAMIYHPLPLNGKIDAKYIHSIPIEITNMRTNIAVVTYTTDQGEYLIDWANSDDKGGEIIKYVYGDTFKIVLLNCKENDECTKYITYKGEPELYTIFDIRSLNLCPIDVTPFKRCDSCCTDCPETTNLNIGVVIGAILTLIVAMGGGIKIYKNRLGDATFQHRHRGIKEYHNPNTKHKNIKYQHRLWKNDPMGCIADVKKMQEYGGLI